MMSQERKRKKKEILPHSCVLCLFIGQRVLLLFFCFSLLRRLECGGEMFPASPSTGVFSSAQVRDCGTTLQVKKKKNQIDTRAIYNVG